jgi:hypothetical protein
MRSLAGRETGKIEKQTLARQKAMTSSSAVCEFGHLSFLQLRRRSGLTGRTAA